MKPKNETMRQQIIDETTASIIEAGVAGTSTVKVAKRINGAQSNIYSYFKNKDALVLGVFTYHQQLLTAALTPVLNADLDPQTQIAAITRALLQFAKTHPTSIQIVAAFRAQPSFRAQLPTIRDSHVFTTLFKRLTDYQARGVVKPLPAEFLAETVFSVIVDFCYAQLAQEAYAPQLSEDAIIALINDMVLA
ncbi:MAG: TetR/AcrR family transcriptional regulator [Lactobacillus sp.]|jgi:AcrR family transcriptional regulator|nr:TetR/AcrR family transcriptional regulator [Lactobacillus sp.]MCI2033396.1 TetR/AcrR family transcriptional regulator [Lactobacillus sp.]